MIDIDIVQIFLSDLMRQAEGYFFQSENENWVVTSDEHLPVLALSTTDFQSSLQLYKIDFSKTKKSLRLSLFNQKC